MANMIDLDWTAMFVPQRSLLELVLRGTIMYLLIFAMLRMVLRRPVGGIGTPDVLVIVLVAEVAGNSIAPSEQSLVEGAILVADHPGVELRDRVAAVPLSRLRTAGA